jgi:Tol biopolymer transport system component
MKIRAASVTALSATLLIAIACQGDGTGPTTPAMPTGTLLAFHPAQIVYTVDAATGETAEIARTGSPIFGWVNGALGPGGKFVSASSFNPQELRLLELATGEVTTVLPLSSSIGVGSTRLSPDGKLLAFSAAGWSAPGQGGLMTVDLASGITSVRWTPPQDDPELELVSLRWLPDQSGFIALAGRPAAAAISKFDLGTGNIQLLTEPMPTNLVLLTLDLSPDGRTIVYSDTEGKLNFITPSGDPAPNFPTDLKGLLPAFSPDGKLLAWSRYVEGTMTIDGIWFYRFSDGEMWRAMPADSPITWLLDWE